MNKKTNIIFLMTDEQRFDCIGYENSIVKTPNLDKLAKESVVFKNAYTTNPSCVPARAAIYTGRFPSQCGVPTYITYLPENEVTFMRLLQEGGYHTAVIGKQHFDRTDIERGYDYMDIVDCHSPNFKSEDCNSYREFLLENGFTSENQLTEKDSRFTNRWIEDDKYFVDSYIGDRSVSWLEDKKPADKPWFLTISFPGPHMPYDGIGLEQANRYDENDIDLPQTNQNDLSQKPKYYMDQLTTGHGNPGAMPVINATEDEIKRVRLAYYSKMSLIDEKIGEIIRVLKETGEYDNTMIIFTSDHGDYMGDFGMVGKGQYLSEVLMHIPFLIKPPISDYTGKEENSFISSVEIAATCLHVAGMDIPNNMFNRSLSQFWNCEEEQEIREDMYMEAQNVRGIRSKEWKLIYYQNRSYGELYHLANDPWEKYNLWDNSDYNEIKIDMMSKMMNWMIKLGANSSIPWNIKAPII